MNESARVEDVVPRNCTQAAIDDFPIGVFTKEQCESGAIVIHIFVSLYLFVALAVVCDKYFVPAVDKICEALNMSNDVAGATFMAAATSAPELFVNVIGTFITEGDIGVGTIVGSAVFNILAVAACCGIGAGIVVPLDWWPLTRDCLAYGLTVSVLIAIIHDERVEWYEALILVLLYGVYIFIMYFDKTFQKCVRGGSRRLATLIRIQDGKKDNGDGESRDAKAPLQANGKLRNSIVYPSKSALNVCLETLDVNSKGDPSVDGTIVKRDNEHNLNINSETEEDDRDNPESVEHNKVTEVNIDEEIAARTKVDAVPEDYEHSLWKWPTNRSIFTKVAWVITWPIYLVFLFTVPDCEKRRFKKWFPLTFFMCIVWIGSLSYFVAWMITIIGHTLKIPDSVMGITFLAAGTSVPEAVSSVIVAKQGHGSMGISNSIGSNTFDILLCLGLPWLIKSSLAPSKPGQYVVEINSSGIEYSAISLLSTLLLLYITFCCNKFKLDKTVGKACLCMYAVFLILATLIELNVFFQVNKPTCD